MGLAGLAFLTNCSRSSDIPPSFINKLEVTAKNFRYFEYPYVMSTFYDKGQTIKYHFEKQEESEEKGKHALVMKYKGKVSYYEIIFDYNKGKITKIKKVKIKK